MKIEGITRVVIHFVTTDEQDYTRYGPDCWSVRMGESDEPVYDCQELEKLFQSALYSEMTNDAEIRTKLK